MFLFDGAVVLLFEFCAKTTTPESKVAAIIAIPSIFFISVSLLC